MQGQGRGMSKRSDQSQERGLITPIVRHADIFILHIVTVLE